MPRPDNGTRQKLIDTARELIWTSSYGHVSVDDICKAAGAKKGSFYHYFPSKQDLAIAMLEEYCDYKIECVMKPVFAANKSFAQQIDDLTAAILQDARKNLDAHGSVCGCPIAAMGSEMIGEDEKVIHEKVAELFLRCRDFLTAAIESAIDSGEIPACKIDAKAEEIHDFITGLMVMARIHNSLDGLERDLGPGLRRILGLKAVKPPVQNKK